MSAILWIMLPIAMLSSLIIVGVFSGFLNSCYIHLIDKKMNSPSFSKTKKAVLTTLIGIMGGIAVFGFVFAVGAFVFLVLTFSKSGDVYVLNYITTVEPVNLVIFAINDLIWTLICYDIILALRPQSNRLVKQVYCKLLSLKRTRRIIVASIIFMVLLALFMLLLYQILYSFYLLDLLKYLTLNF